ncbi:MAG: phosphotransferase [Planctomycetota bacterium]|nr:phosphotransferase [Planctomycetota bacterium]
MAECPDPLAVLAAYPAVVRPTRLLALGGAGGFSGARFWRAEAEAGPYCLRRWPADYPGPAELRFIHAVLRHARERGFCLAPVPLEARGGQPYVSRGGHLWELSPWMPGKADFAASPTAPRLKAAAACLAEFHRAVEDLCWTGSSSGPGATRGEGPSPGIAHRLAVLREWLTVRARLLHDALAGPAAWPEIADRAERVLKLLPRAAPAVYDQLASVQRHRVPLQPCLGDIWHDHLLSQGDRVTGLVDFGAMRWDNVSCDLARLLGSLAGSNRALWEVGVSAYEAVRPVSEAERNLANAFDVSGLLLGALNWASWTILDGRVFEEPCAVLQRMDDLIARLETLQFDIPNRRGLVL